MARRLVIAIPGDLPLLPAGGVTQRQKWFLELTGGLALVVHINNRKWFGVIPARHDPPGRPQLASTSGSAHRAEALLQHSASWQAVINAKQSHSLGNTERHTQELSWDTFYIGLDERTALRARPEERCGLCESSTDMSSEHCTPDWLTTRMRLVPITARILCRPCNERLGIDLESLFPAVYDAGEVSSHPDVTARWCLKTAVMLALAGSAPVPKNLLDAVPEGSAAEASTQVFVMQTEDVLDAFWFNLTYFGSDLRREGAFVCSFGFERFAALVIQWPGQCVAAMPLMTRVSPDHSPDRPSYGRAEDGPHADVLAVLTGEEHILTPVERTPVTRSR